MENNSDIEFLHFGIKTIDLQHRKFLTLLNELKMYNLIRDDNNTMLDIIDELKAYSKYHFEMERRIMVRSNFPEIDVHIDQHEVFIQKIDQFRAAYNYQSASLSDQMLVFLQKWFLVHIPDWDSKYVEYIQQKKQLPV